MKNDSFYPIHYPVYVFVHRKRLELRCIISRENGLKSALRILYDHFFMTRYCLENMTSDCHVADGNRQKSGKKCRRLSRLDDSDFCTSFLLEAVRKQNLLFFN